MFSSIKNKIFSNTKNKTFLHSINIKPATKIYQHTSIIDNSPSAGCNGARKRTPATLLIKTSPATQQEVKFACAQHNGIAMITALESGKTIQTIISDEISNQGR